MVACLERLLLTQTGAEVTRGLDDSVDGYTIILQLKEAVSYNTYAALVDIHENLSVERIPYHHL